MSPVQLTTGRIGNLTRLISTLLKLLTIHTYTYIHCSINCSVGDRAHNIKRKIKGAVDDSVHTSIRTYEMILVRAILSMYTYIRSIHGTVDGRVHAGKIKITDVVGQMVYLLPSYRRYFQHAHFIPTVGVGKRGAYQLVHGDLPRQHPFGTTLNWPCAGRLSAVNTIGTQLRDPINSGLTRWWVTV